MIEFNIADMPDQKLSVTLNNQRVTLRLRYNPSSDRWTLDLALDDLPIMHGRRIVLDVDLIEQLNLDIGHLFAVAVVPGAMPDRQQLVNGNVRLYHLSDGELNAPISS